MSPSIPPPVVDRDTAWFWDSIQQQGEIRFQRCLVCRRWRHPPSPLCRHCGSLRWSGGRPSGRGHVVSWVIPHRPRFDGLAERVLVLVELDEGIRFFSDLIGDDRHAVDFDSRVELIVDPGWGHGSMPRFRLAEPGAERGGGAR